MKFWCLLLCIISLVFAAEKPVEDEPVLEKNTEMWKVCMLMCSGQANNPVGYSLCVNGCNERYG